MSSVAAGLVLIGIGVFTVTIARAQGTLGWTSVVPRMRGGGEFLVVLLLSRGLVSRSSHHRRDRPGRR